MTLSPSVTSPAISNADGATVRGLPVPGDIDLMELGLIAKSVCSGLHISQRTLEDLFENSVRDTLSSGAKVTIDLNHAGQVTARAAHLARTAINTGDQGCVLLPIGAKHVLFEPRAIPEHLPTTSLPLPDAPHPAFAEAADAAFAPSPDTATAAVAIWHRGHLVAERYGPHTGPKTCLENWSMGKSAIALLIACAAADGFLAMHDPIALREWQHQPEDPRNAITFDHALRMSSGIDFSAPWAEDYDRGRHGYPDHGYIYSGAIDIRALTASRLSLHPPGSFGAYKNSDTLLLLAGLEDRLHAAGLDPLTWPYTRLFRPAGATSLVFETDPYGHLFGTGNVYGTARDWIALGALFLSRARAEAVGLDTETLQSFASPSPGWRGKYWMADAPNGFNGSIYGRQVWLNQHAPEDRWPAPDDTFFFLGVGGQYTFIIPSLDLVIVRLGHIRKTVETGAGRGHVPALVRLACGAAEDAHS